MQALPPVSCHVVGLAAIFLLTGLPTAARALPTCPPASPAQISTPKLQVDQIWQRYRTLTPEHRCCAKPCEPLARFAAKVEANALNLNAVARNPKVPPTTRQQALANSNEMFKQRGNLATEFIGCLNDTRPRPGPSGTVCGEPTIPKVTLAWVRWCDAFTDGYGRFRDLLASTTGTSVGSWSVQSNFFRVKAAGYVDSGSASIKPYPATQLPAGKATKPFRDLIEELRFPPFPAGTVQSRMYMQYTSKFIRLPGASGPPLDTSPILQGACPGPTSRPAG